MTVNVRGIGLQDFGKDNVALSAYEPPNTTNSAGRHVHSPEPSWPSRRTHGPGLGCLASLRFLPKRRAVQGAVHGPHGLITRPLGPVENTVVVEGLCPRNGGVGLVNASAGGRVRRARESRGRVPQSVSGGREGKVGDVAGLPPGAEARWTPLTPAQGSPFR